MFVSSWMNYFTPQSKGMMLSKYQLRTYSNPPHLKFVCYTIYSSVHRRAFKFNYAGCLFAIGWYLLEDWNVFCKNILPKPKMGYMSLLITFIRRYNGCICQLNTCSYIQNNMWHGWLLLIIDYASWLLNS